MKRTLMRAALVLTLILSLAAPVLPVEAASPAMPAIGSSTQALTFHVSGQFTTTKTNLVKLNVPYPITVLYVTAAAQAKGGTHGTTRLTVLNAGTVLADGMDLGNTAAGTVIEGAVESTGNEKIAKDAALSVDLTQTGGSSPTVDHITLTIWVQRRN